MIEIIRPKARMKLYQVVKIIVAVLVNLIFVNKIHNNNNTN